MKNILSSSCLHRFIDRVASSYQSLKYLFPYPDRFYGICLHRLGMNHTFPSRIFTVCFLTPIQNYLSCLIISNTTLQAHFFCKYTSPLKSEYFHIAMNQNENSQSL